MRRTGGIRRRFGCLVLVGLFSLATVPGAASELSAPSRPSEEEPPPRSSGPISQAADRSGSVALHQVAAAANLEAGWEENPRRAVLSRDSLRIEFEPDSRAIRFNGIRVFLGEPVQSAGATLRLSEIDYRTLIRPLLAPGAGPAPGGPVKTIVIDAGHGGRDPGTRSTALGLVEKDMTLDVARRLRGLLTERGYRVILTRQDDSYISLERRAEIANRAGGDLFISIHFNAVGTGSVTGTETFVLTPRHHRSTGQGERGDGDAEVHPGNRYDHWNALLGFYVQRQLLHDLRSFDRGIKRARFSVLREVDCPAVLVEAGYLSNVGEARRIGSVAYRERLARSLVRAVGHYDRTVGPRVE